MKGNGVARSRRVVTSASTSFGVATGKKKELAATSQQNEAEYKTGESAPERDIEHRFGAVLAQGLIQERLHRRIGGRNGGAIAPETLVRLESDRKELLPAFLVKFSAVGYSHGLKADRSGNDIPVGELCQLLSRDETRSDTMRCTSAICDLLMIVHIWDAGILYGAFRELVASVPSQGNLQHPMSISICSVHERRRTLFKMSSIERSWRLASSA